MNKQNRKTRKPKLLCLLLAAALVCAAGIVPCLTASAAETPTSLGLAAHGIKAHRDGWIYVSGGKGQTIGNTRGSDCAGLLYAYFSDVGSLGNCRGGATSQVEDNCVFSNDISEGIPRIHGLALTMPDYYDPGTGIYGHIGIYIGNNEATDNSDTNYNMRREPVVGSGRNWTAWHVFDNGMKYPVDGWYELDGKMVHYTNYEYDADTVIDGYSINAAGYAEMPGGTFYPVDSSLLSARYASASQVAAYLRTKYSGKDSTYELIYGGSSGDDPDPAYNGRITGNGVHLRQGAGTGFQILNTLPRGTYLNILGEVSGESVTADGKTSDVWYSVTTAGGQSGYVSSLFAERLSTGVLSTPVITAENGYVTISAGSANANIYYTTDCSQPDENSALYTGPLYMTGYTYKAIAMENGKQTDVATATVLSNSSVFTDFTTKDWFYRAVDAAVAAEIFHGAGNGIFAPTRNITRGEFVLALAGLSRADLSSYTNGTSYSDVTNKTAPMTKAIAWASDIGCVKGFEDGSFRPNDPISREQMCVILASYAGLERSETSTVFADERSIGSWAKNAVYACRDNGLISGVGDNKFAPKATATRAEACVVKNNLYNK